MRAYRWLLAIFLCAAMTGIGLAAVSPAQGTPDGVKLGARVQPRGGETAQTAFLRMETQVGRTLGVAREFLRWDASFPTSFHTWLRDTGHTLVLSVRPRLNSGVDVPWQEIADAEPGSPRYQEIVAWGERIRDFGAPIYFAFNHEPETKASASNGTDAQFKAAWKKVYDIFHGLPGGVPNVKFIWIMTDYAFTVGPEDSAYAANWYPGDEYVEAMGADPYNWYDCRPDNPAPWRSLEQLIRPFRDFGAQHPQEELWLTEWGSVEDSAQPGRKAQWFAEARELFKRADYAQFQGVTYFDYLDPLTCNWPVDSSTSSLSGFATMANDVFYGGTVQTPPPPPKLAYHAVAGSNGNRTTHSVKIPTSVQAGDTLFAFYTANRTVTITGSPQGWTPLTSADVSGLRGRVWVRTATDSDAGATVTVATGVTHRADLSVVAYRGTATNPVDLHKFDARASTGSTYTAPSVELGSAQAGDWILAYWADKSSYNTGHTIPATVTRRRTFSGSSSNHITATIADSNGGVPAGKQGPFAAKGTAGSSAWLAYTIAVRPAASS
jgi:hypothetical protein